jgi:predicted aspartyl protease
MLDTGTTALIVSQKLAVNLHLNVTDTSYVLHNAGEKVNLGLNRKVESLRIDEIEFIDLNATVLDLRNFNDSKGIDGVLGAQIFKDCVLTIDYRKHEIVISYPKQSSPLLKRKNSYLPIKLVAYKIPAVPIKVNGREFWCVIDSGYSGSFSLPQRAVEKIPLLTKFTALPTSKVTFIKRIPEKKARICGSVLFSQYKFSEPIIAFEGDTALMGGETLKNFKVIIDQKNMCAHFIRDTNEPIPPCPSIRHHGFFFQRDNNGLIVTGAIEGLSLEQMGLITRDRIVSVNDIQVSNLTNEQLKSIVVENDSLKIKIMREEKEIFIDVPVTGLIP